MKKATFAEGLQKFIELRNAKGYHSKTIAYSIWHIIRIEDNVVNTLIREKKEILFEQDFTGKIGTSAITTGNEWKGEKIEEFSKTLNLDILYAYARAVKETMDEWLKGLLKCHFPDTGLCILRRQIE